MVIMARLAYGSMIKTGVKLSISTTKFSAPSMSMSLKRELVIHIASPGLMSGENTNVPTEVLLKSIPSTEVKRNEFSVYESG